MIQPKIDSLGSKETQGRCLTRHKESMVNKINRDYKQEVRKDEVNLQEMA